MQDILVVIDMQNDFLMELLERKRLSQLFLK